MQNIRPNLSTYFKTRIEEHLGEISFLQGTAGEIGEAMDMVNGANGSKGPVFTVICIAGKKHKT